jgi:hypothetical protein
MKGQKQMKRAEGKGKKPEDREGKEEDGRE